MLPILRLALLGVLFACPAAAKGMPFIGQAQLDLMRLLPPPPAEDSAQARADMAEVLALQQARTPERAAQARADATQTLFEAFAPVLGPAFAQPALPLTSALFDRLFDTESAVTAPLKRGYARKRPFMVNAEVHPAAPLSKSGSYPSGHATRVTMVGIVLAAMAPEHRAAIFARVADYAESRVIGGVHFPTDIEAGQRAGTAIDAVLFNDPAFQAEYGPARAEVRRALGLVP